MGKSEEVNDWKYHMALHQSGWSYAVINRCNRMMRFFLQLNKTGVLVSVKSCLDYILQSDFRKGESHCSHLLCNTQQNCLPDRILQILSCKHTREVRQYLEISSFQQSLMEGNSRAVEEVRRRQSWLASTRASPLPGHSEEGCSSFR